MKRNNDRQQSNISKHFCVDTQYRVCTNMYTALWRLGVSPGWGLGQAGRLVLVLYTLMFRCILVLDVSLTFQYILVLFISLAFQNILVLDMSVNIVTSPKLEYTELGEKVKLDISRLFWFPPRISHKVYYRPLGSDRCSDNLSRMHCLD